MKNNTSQIRKVLTRGVTEVLPFVETLVDIMSQRKIRLYLGIDPTGAFLTLGHLVLLRKLQQFADLGHEVILLIGNGTVRIGDPTGRDTTRPMLTDGQIQENFKDWRAQAQKVLDFDKIIIRFNGDWLDKLTFTDLVKLMAQTTIQQLTERDMFQERMKKKLPIFGHEIMYPLLQGFDSVAMDVDLEIGGNDQKFNMLMGRHLQKIYNQREKWVLTTPILNGTDGRKMSKSFGNFIALSDEPKQMFGKLMSIPDDQIMDYATLLTDMEEEQIVEIQKVIEGGKNPMSFKKDLAFRITEMLHSTESALKAQEHFEKTVQKGERPENIPVIKLSKSKQILTDLVAQLKDVSKTQARQLIMAGAVELNDSKQTDPQKKIELQPNDVIKVGKRWWVRVKVVN